MPDGLGLNASGVGDLTELANGVDGLERARDDLPGAQLVRLVDESVFQKLRVGQDDAELVVEPVEEKREINIVGYHSSSLTKRLCGPGRHCFFGLPPQSVLEDSDGSAGRADVLHLAA